MSVSPSFCVSGEGTPKNVPNAKGRGPTRKKEKKKQFSRGGWGLGGWRGGAFSEV
jgi:hypothetical protein